MPEIELGPDFYRGCDILLSEEIELGEHLAITVRLTRPHDVWREEPLRDPASVFSRLEYGRWVVADNLLVLRCARRYNQLPLTNSDIMLPSNAAWPQFIERIEQARRESLYPAKITRSGEDISIYGAATSLYLMGFAVAESLAVYDLLDATTDQQIIQDLSDAWRKQTATTNKATRRNQARARRRAR